MSQSFAAEAAGCRFANALKKTDHYVVAALKNRSRVHARRATARRSHQHQPLDIKAVSAVLSVFLLEVVLGGVGLSLCHSGLAIINDA